MKAWSVVEEFKVDIYMNRNDCNTLEHYLEMIILDETLQLDKQW